MKLEYFDTPIPKYKNKNISELISLLKRTEKPREKAPILISMSLINQDNFQNELSNCLLSEVADNLNIQRIGFGTLTVSMVAAIVIIQLNINIAADLKNVVYQNWSEHQISDFKYILKSEGFDIECWFDNLP